MTRPAAQRLSDRVRCLRAPNPGLMTGPGTNSYLIGTTGIAVIDPGPAIEAHLEALIAQAHAPIRWILATHTHLDHSPGVARLAARTGACVLGRPAPEHGLQDRAFRADRVLQDGDTLAGDGFTLRAIHTPGHASNHLCYLLEEEGMLFTGDHIMQGSTVVISPPDGDMGDYLRSLQRLRSMPIRAFAPGHGALIEDPQASLEALIAHRLQRERKVLDALAAARQASTDELLPLVYDDVPRAVRLVARRSLEAHLRKLAADGRVAAHQDCWRLIV